MPDSYGTIPFTLVVTQHERRTTAQVEVAKVPYGDTTVVFLGGQQPETIAGTAYFVTQADYNNFRFRVGLGVQALIYPEYPDPGIYAILTEVGRSVRLEDGRQTARVSFILLDEVPLV